MKLLLQLSLVCFLLLAICGWADDTATKDKPADAGAREVAPEPGATAPVPIFTYSFHRDSNGDMTFNVSSTSKQNAAVNDPTEELVAIVDHALKNPAHHTPTYYTTGGKYGIQVEGEVKGATASDGSPLTHYRFRRVSSGDYELRLSGNDGSLHGGWGLPWDTVLAVVRSVSSPATSTLKVVKTSDGSTILISNRTFELDQ